MPKINISKLPTKTGSSYPAPHHLDFEGRHQTALGNGAGLTQFGVNLVKLEPGARSSLRHWHQEQDEFLVVMDGTLTLVDDTGDTELHPGDCAAFPAGDENGHHMVNKSNVDGSFIVVGTRTDTETGWYSDVDMMVRAKNGQMTFTRKDGSPV